MSFTTDYTGTIYIGTYDHGLLAYDVAKKELKAILPDELSKRHVSALASDRRGRVWIGTMRNGLSVYNGEQVVHYHPFNSTHGWRITQLKQCRNTSDIWVISEQGLVRHAARDSTWRAYTILDGLKDHRIVDIDFARRGHLLALSELSGLYEAKANKLYEEVTHEVKLPLKYFATHITRRGLIYIATNKGLYTKVEGEQPKLISKKQFKQVMSDRSQRVWLLTQDGKTYTFENDNLKSVKLTEQKIERLFTTIQGGLLWVDEAGALSGHIPKQWQSMDRWVKLVCRK